MELALVQPAAASRGLVLWLLATLAFWVALVAAGVLLSDAPPASVVYQLVLFPLCTFPALVLAREPRYRLLAFFMLVYYAMFGMLDLVLMFTRSQYQIYDVSSGIVRTERADWVIVGGGMLLMLAYLGVAALWPRSTRSSVRQWTYRHSLAFGFVAWAVGICAHFVVQFVYADRGPEQVGLVSHTISNLYYLAFLGDAIIVVTAIQYKGSRAPWLLIMLMIAVEYTFGFLGNIKEVSYRLLALILICSFFARGRVSVKLVLLIVVSFVPYQALFNVYREQVLQAGRKTALEAAGTAQQSADTVLHDFGNQRNSMFRSMFIMLDRVDGRKYVEIITQHVGSDVPYQDGSTLMLFIYSFVPEMWWHEKPQISTGQLMNRTFKLSASPKTFVPSTLLGEFYWNYGVAGVAVGMLCLGAIFAGINCFFLTDGRCSTAGFLVLLVAAYFFALRFEASVGSQFGQFVRVAMILGAINELFGMLGWRERHAVAQTSSLSGATA